jgi:hypothetical protein
MSGKKKNISNSSKPEPDYPVMTLQEAYTFLQGLQHPVRKCFVAHLLGMKSGDGAMLRLERDRLLMTETEKGWVKPLEKLP